MDSPDDYDNLKKHDLLGRIDCEKLYQPFLEKINTALTACVERGAIYVATNGLRTYAEQNALYAIGRTVAPIGKSHFVTMAPAGYSGHQFGIAIDVVRHKGATYEGKLDPDYSDAAFEIWAEELEKVGLEAGLRWKFKDSPHGQVPIKNKHITWSILRGWYTKGGYSEVFKQLDAHGPW